MAKKKKELPKTEEEFIAYQKRFIIATLRRGSLYWPYRNEALKLARVDRGLYKCALCEKIHHKSNVQVDHIAPVVKLSGLTDWNLYFSRMYVKTDGYQILCKECHSEKSKEEQVLRKINRDSKKKKK